MEAGQEGAVEGGAAAGEGGVPGAPPPAAPAKESLLGDGAATAPTTEWLYEPKASTDLAKIPLPGDVLGGKYKTVADLVSGASAAVAQRDAVNEKLKGFAGPPVDETGNFKGYELKAPEGYEVEFGDKSHPMLGEMQKVFADAGASQPFFDSVMGLLVRYEAERASTNIADEMSALVDHYRSPELVSAKQQELNAFFLPMMDDQARQLLAEISTDHRIVLLMDGLKRAITSSRIPVDVGDALGREEIDRAAKDPDLLKDPAKLKAFEERIQAGARHRR